MTLQRTLNALSDRTCQSIIHQILDEQLTARELVERCECSRSTIYRKLQTLSECGLVRQRTRIRRGTRDATEFEPAVDAIRIDLCEQDGLTLECTEPDTTRGEDTVGQGL